MPGHPVVHFEIGCHDSGRTAAFFAELFGWGISDAGAARMIDTGGAKGIVGHFAELASEWGTYVTVYVEVEDLEASLEKAKELGGKTLVNPVDLPGQGSFAWLGSPEGHIIGLWKAEYA